MKYAVSAFLQYASATGLPKRDKAALLVFSRLIAFQLPLPSSPVESANNFYSDTLTVQASAMVSEVNESIIVDVPFLLEVVRKVWLARYELVYKPLSASVHLMVAAILTSDSNAFSDELRAADVALSENNVLTNLTALCLDAIKLAAPAMGE